MTIALALTYRPMINPWLIAVLVGLAAIAAAWSCWRDPSRVARVRVGLLTCRLIAVGGMGWILAGPSAVTPGQARDAAPALTVLADVSKSMNQPLAPSANAAAPSRWDALRAHWLTETARDTLGQHAKVRWYRFAQDASATRFQSLQAAAAKGERTHVFEALRQISDANHNADDNTANPVLLLSDGHDTQRSAAPDVTAALKRRGRRVFVVPFGQAGDERRLHVQSWPDSDRVYEGDPVTLMADVRHRGLANKRVRVTLRRNGESLAQRTLRLGQSISRRVQFEVTPATEPNETTTTRLYEVTAAPINAAEGEGAPQESDERAGVGPASATVFVTVTKQRMRVLLLEGAPYWDTRAFARIVRSHPRMALTAIYRLGDQRTLVVDQAAMFQDAGDQPLTLDQLKRFDVVALGKRVDRFFDPASSDRLTQYVRQGGALVLTRGQPVDAQAVATPTARALATSLSPILPVTWGRDVVDNLRLSLTPAGRDSPLFQQAAEDGQPETVFTDLPTMLAATRVARAKSASIVTLKQQPRESDGRASMAAMAHMRVGSGRVLAVLSDGLWRWSLLSGSHEDASDSARAAPLGTFWSRALHWLAAGGEFLPGQNLSLTIEPRQPRAGQPVRVTLQSRYPLGANVTPRLTMTPSTAEPRTLELTSAAGQAHRYVATFRPKHVGSARLRVDPASLPEGDDSLNDPQAGPEARLIVRPASVEQADTTPRPDVLTRIAKTTDGQTLPVDGVDALADHLQALATARRPSQTIDYIFDRWFVLAVIALSLLGEWVWRQRTGEG